MKFHLSLLTVLVLVLAMGMGCGGGGSSSGGGSSATLVGTWNLVSFSGGTSGAPPQRLVFSADGTGTYAGAQPSATGSTSGSFTWTQQGNQVTMRIQGGNTVTINNLPSPVGNNLTLVDSTGQTSSWTRA